MEAQWLLIKELGKSEEQVKTRLNKMITEKILEGAREVLEAIEKKKKGNGLVFLWFFKKGNGNNGNWEIKGVKK